MLRPVHHRRRRCTAARRQDGTDRARGSRGAASVATGQWKSCNVLLPSSTNRIPPSCGAVVSPNRSPPAFSGSIWVRRSQRARRRDLDRVAVAAVRRDQVTVRRGHEAERAVERHALEHREPAGDREGRVTEQRVRDRRDAVVQRVRDEQRPVAERDAGRPDDQRRRVELLVEAAADHRGATQHGGAVGAREDVAAERPCRRWRPPAQPRPCRSARWSRTARRGGRSSPTSCPRGR